MECCVTGCEKQVKAGGRFCSMHYSRAARARSGARCRSMHAPQQERLALKARVLEGFRAALQAQDSDDDAAAARSEAYAFALVRRLMRTQGWAPRAELLAEPQRAGTAEVPAPPSDGRGLRAIK